MTINPFEGKFSNFPIKPTAQEVKDFHDNDDVDANKDSHHHRLGTKPYQAAPGDHKHVDAGIDFNPNLSNAASVILTGVDVKFCQYACVGDLVFFHFNIELKTTPTQADHAYLDLPFEPLMGTSPSHLVLGSGREDQVTGDSLQISTRKNVGVRRALIARYNNTTTITNGFKLLGSGIYIRKPV